MVLGAKRSSRFHSPHATSLLQQRAQAFFFGQVTCSAQRSSAHSIIISRRCSGNATGAGAGAGWQRGARAVAGRQERGKKCDNRNNGSSSDSATYLVQRNGGARCGVGAFSPKFVIIEGRQRGCDGCCVSSKMSNSDVKPLSRRSLL